MRSGEIVQPARSWRVGVVDVCNLCRAELSPAQRAAAIKRRREIWTALHPESGTSGPTLPMTGRGNTQFAADTAKVSGESKREVNRHLARADALGNDLTAVAGTSLDKGVELDALKAMPVVSVNVSGQRSHAPHVA